MVPGDNTQVVRAEEARYDEPCVLCIVRDMTTTDWQLCKLSLDFPASATARQLVQEVAQKFRYESNSFELVLQLDTGDSVVVSDKLDETLSDLGFSSLGKIWSRNLLIVNEKNGEPPKRIEAGEDTNVSLDDLSLGASASPVGGGDGDRAYAAPTPPSSSYSPLTDYNCSYSAALIKQDTGYVGLVNQAMTCYLNSLLQTLFMTPEFRNALYRWEFDEKEKPSKSIPFQLQKLFLQLQTTKRHAIETTELTRSFGWDSSEAWHQHDVQELCRVMFDALEKKFAKTDQADLINQLYQGKLKDYVKCLECGYESAREDTYLDIPLPVRPFGQTQAYGSVEEALRAFVQPEVLDGSNQYCCERCNKKCDAHKGLKFIQFPYLLTLQLKRFDFDYNTMHRIKLNDKVTFPEILNLNSFIKVENEQMETNDDASTSDSGSALDDDIGAPPSNAPSHISSNDEGIDDEGIDLGSSSTLLQNNHEMSANEKNLRHSMEKGPYLYELFSIMVHSGSANGGHYYAYIKSFKEGQWYCFNDQSVSRITYDDIRKTYGGGPIRGYYSGAYSSSTNAYMLMYRQINKDRNAEAMPVEEFPEHIKKLLEDMQEQEEQERQKRELERSMCRIKVYCHHPVQNRMIDRKLQIHKDCTLAEATSTAHMLLGLDGVIPLNLCRLVKYDEMHDSLECSFEDSDDLPIGELLGGAKSNYKFDLLLEIRPPDKQFVIYRPGGTTVKIYNVNIDTEEVDDPKIVRGCLNQTVDEFKALVAENVGLPSSTMRMVLVKYSNDFRPLCSGSKSLKSEGFFRSNRVFIECSDCEDSKLPFIQSKMCQIIDRFEHTVSLNVVLPVVNKEILERLGFPTKVDTSVGNASGEPDAHSESKQYWLGASGDNVPNDTVSLTLPHMDSGPRGSQSMYMDDEGIGDTECDVGPSYHGNGSGGVHSDQSEDSSLTDSDRTLVRDDAPRMTEVIRVMPSRGGGSSDSNSPQESCEDDQNLSSPEELHIKYRVKNYHKAEDYWDDEMDRTDQESQEDIKRYFRAMPINESHVCDKRYSGSSTDSSEVRGTMLVYVDKRITLGAFKKELAPFVGVGIDFFKVYRLYINNQEFECMRVNENLGSFSDYTTVIIRLGRVLKKGEYNVKIYQLQISESEPAKFLIEWIFVKGMTVLEAKKAILPEIAAKCGLEVPLNRCRLRKKSWRTPGIVLLDNQQFEEDIPIFANWEVFLEILSGPEPVTLPNQLAVFVRRWRPSTCSLEPLQEIILDNPSIDELKSKLSEVSGITSENIDYAKGAGTFPCEVSLLTISKDLDWNPTIIPRSISEDVPVIYYRDAEEDEKELTEDEKRELSNREHAKFNKGTRGTYSPRKERALKIYTDSTPLTVSTTTDPDLD